MYDEYLDKVIGKHSHVDREWVDQQIRAQLTETEQDILDTAQALGPIARLGISLGVRQTINGDGDIVKIYHKNECVATRTFMRPVAEEES